MLFRWSKITAITGIVGGIRVTIAYMYIYINIGFVFALMIKARALYARAPSLDVSGALMQAKHRNRVCW